MQVIFCGKTKENIIAGTDENSEQALANATAHMERYGAEAAIAAEFSTKDGLIIHLVGTGDYVEGLHFNSTNNPVNRTILEMFGFHPLGDLQEMSDSWFGWSKSREKFLAGVK